MAKVKVNILGNVNKGFDEAGRFAYAAHDAADRSTLAPEDTLGCQRKHVSDCFFLDMAGIGAPSYEVKRDVGPGKRGTVCRICAPERRDPAWNTSMPKKSFPRHS